MQVHNWPGSTVVLGGLKTKVNSARLLTTGAKVDVKQEEFRVQFTGMPQKAPEQPITTIEVECAGEPIQDTDWVRKERPRRGVGV